MTIENVLLTIFLVSASIVTQGCDDNGDANTPETQATAAPQVAPQPTYTIHRGDSPWHHWNHPDFARPSFSWEWSHVKTVTCTAEDSRGHLYPVTEDGYSGQEYQETVTQTEDSAIDRCYAESTGDTRCRYQSCVPEY